MATINGTAGNDTLAGTSGDDTINGLGGNDLFLAGGTGGGGADFIDGGTGTDSIEFRERATSGIVVDFSAGTITGGGTGTISFTGVERVVAGNFNDSLSGNAAAQTLTGQGGADTLWGAGGVDTLWGGSGADTFIFREIGTANADRISDWASGADTLLLDGTVMSALGASGDFAAGDVRFWSSASGVAHDADDRIIFNTTTRQVFYDADGSGSGAAQLIATLSSATLVATDIVVEGGSSGGATITGTVGNDSLAGTDGSDTINGLGGSDTLNGLAGDDRLDGGTGNDSLHGGDGADVMVGADGNDTLDGLVRLDDFGQFEAHADTMDGGLGDDLFIVDHDGDILSDSGGIDTVRVHERSWTLGADFENLTIFNAVNEGSHLAVGNDRDNIITVSFRGRLEGHGGNDLLIGGSSSGVLLGGDGNDTLDGRGDFNSLDGGAGDDLLHSHSQGAILTGGAGADVFALHEATGDFGPRHDITDFVAGVDSIQLDGSNFDRTGTSGRFTAGDERFHAAAGATGGHDITDRVIYDTSTGDVYYDSDGSGAGAAILLTRVSALAATDITIVNGGASGATINGTDQNDSLNGTAADDTINGLGGNDTIDGQEGDDLLDGGAGHDVLFGTAGLDVLLGRDGNDTLHGGSGTSFDGGLGDDTYFISGHNATVLDAGGFDVVISAVTHALADGVENLILRTEDVENVGGFGNELDNVIRNEGPASVQMDGRGGDDTLIGGPGGDSFSFFGNNGDAGNDFVDGAAGDDTLHAGFFGDAVVDFRAGTVTGVGGSVRFLNIEGATGGLGDDLLIADDGGRRLYGWIGDDTMIGGAGDDFFAAGSADERGRDSIDGGGGTDTVYFEDEWGPAVVNLGAGTLTVGTNSSATLASIENFIGTQFGDDFIVGSSASNVLYGHGGNDTIDGGAGNDTLVGGDDAFPSNFRDTFVFSVAPGSANADVVEAFHSNEDTIRIDGRAHAGIGSSGRFAADDARFHAAAGASSGHDADDRVIYNTLTGDLWYDADGSSSGTSQLLATLTGAPTINAADIDVIHGGVTAGTPGNDSLVGTSGDDSIEGFAGDDTIRGLAGDDNLVGHSGNDLLDGGEGRDNLHGFEGDDTLIGGTGDGTIQANFLNGGAGADVMIGGSDNDVFDVDDVGDVVSDSGGRDAIFSSISYSAPDWVEQLSLTGSAPINATGNSFNNTVTGNAGANLIQGLGGHDWLGGEDGNDTLNGGTGNDTMFGLGGNDLVLAGGNADNDTVDGGIGTDSIEFRERATSAVIVDFGTGSITGGGTGTISFSNVERVVAGNFNDRLSGNAAAQTLTGQAGADTLAGAGGVDTLWGGGGADTFIFRETGTANADRISDWASGSDKIALDNAVMSALGTDGNFSSGDARFAAGAGFTSGRDATDRVIYNTSTGSLYYDADGSGTGAAQLIATLQSGAAVAATDITVI